MAHYTLIMVTDDGKKYVGSHETLAWAMACVMKSLVQEGKTEDIVVFSREVFKLEDAARETSEEDRQFLGMFIDMLDVEVIIEDAIEDKEEKEKEEES